MNISWLGEGIKETYYRLQNNMELKDKSSL